MQQQNFTSLPEKIQPLTAGYSPFGRVHPAGHDFPPKTRLRAARGTIQLSLFTPLEMQQFCQSAFAGHLQNFVFPLFRSNMQSFPAFGTRRKNPIFFRLKRNTHTFRDGCANISFPGLNRKHSASPASRFPLPEPTFPGPFAKSVRHFSEHAFALLFPEMPANDALPGAPPPRAPPAALWPESHLSAVPSNGKARVRVGIYYRVLTLFSGAFLRPTWRKIPHSTLFVSICARTVLRNQDTRTSICGWPKEYRDDVSE